MRTGPFLWRASTQWLTSVVHWLPSLPYDQALAAAVKANMVVAAVAQAQGRCTALMPEEVCVMAGPVPLAMPAASAVQPTAPGGPSAPAASDHATKQHAMAAAVHVWSTFGLWRPAVPTG